MIVRGRAFGRILFGRTALQAAIVVAIIAATGAAAAQTGPGVSNALQGLSQNGDKPVQIKAQTFEVRDKDKIATFSGNVHVVQGDTTIRCKSLVVTYAVDTAAGGAPAAQPGPGGKSQISKLEALGNVIVTQNDQTATGERGVFDLRTKIVTLIGNVVVSQGQNVMRGDRLVVDLNTGISRVESGKARGVEMLIDQSRSNAPKPGAPPREAPRLDQLRPAQPN
jgi:lipopolysaccharide export system protein LptA